MAHSLQEIEEILEEVDNRSTTEDLSPIRQAENNGWYDEMYEVMYALDRTNTSQ